MYEIKVQTIVEYGSVATDAARLPVLKGWRQGGFNKERPPFIYLGYKYEDWTYNYQHTNKIHYVLWQEDIYVMDNQFAKHVVPLWDGEENGED